MQDPQLIRQLKIRRANMKRRGKALRLRLPRVIAPTSLERELAALLKERARVLKLVVSEVLAPRLNSILSSDNMEKPKLDALTDDLSVALNSIKIEFARRYEPTKLKQLLGMIAQKIGFQNAGQQNKVLKSVLGLDVFRQEPWLTPQISNFVEQNVALITSVDEQYFGKIQESVFRGARTGASTKSIAEEIVESSGVSESRAAFIARDQVQKFNGQLTMLRQTQLGVSRYRWRTALDERVRPEHSSREGEIFDWDNPPDGGAPGEDYNCRCYAEPILEDLIEEDDESEEI